MNHANFLAAERAKAILSRGEGAVEEMLSLLKVFMADESEKELALASEDFGLLNRHTYNSVPTTQGLYLKLLHGRTPCDQELADWGDDGPWIGPLRWFHCTYLSTFSLGFTSGEEYLSVTDRKIPAPIYFYDGMIYFRGTYYGDWEIQTLP